jgi:cell division protein FtsB
MTTAFRRLAYSAVILVAGGFAFAHLRGPNGIPALIEKRKAIRSLEEQNESLRKDNERRRLRNKDLQHNPDAQDLEIRKRTEKLKKGETSFKIPE